MTSNDRYISGIKLNPPSGEQLVGKTTNDFIIKLPNNNEFTFKVDAQGNITIY